MQLGVIGLGRMGANIARRLHRGGHRCVVYDRMAGPVAELAAEGLTPASDVPDLVKKLDPPRAVWVMLPAGAITEGMVNTLSELVSAGDILIDGGNTFYKDDIRRAKTLEAKNIAYVDVGTSGGIWGLERGYCMMIGGSKVAVDHLDPIFNTLAPGQAIARIRLGGEARDPRAERGYIHAGPAGAGHFVKMIDNGIEYGLMQAYAEGFDILTRQGPAALPETERFTLDIADIAEVWRRGSVISSWLLDRVPWRSLTTPPLQTLRARSRIWVKAAGPSMRQLKRRCPSNVLAASLFARFVRASNTPLATSFCRRCASNSAAMS